MASSEGLVRSLLKFIYLGATLISLRMTFCFKRTEEKDSNQPFRSNVLLCIFSCSENLILFQAAIALEQGVKYV